MRKILLTTTLLVATGVATQAGAFGGLGILGHKSHHSGVSSIGVHYNGTDDKPNIDIRNCDSETEELVGSECLPKCPEGIERNTDNSCSVCAGENANVYLSYMDDPCGIDTPMNEQECEVASDCWWGQGGDTCCVNGKCRAGYFETAVLYICPSGDDKKECKSNKDCGTGKFCNLESTDGDLPSIGTCMDIGIKDVDYVEGVVEDLGKVKISNKTMSWWGAENWCKAQGMHMATIELLKCYQSGTNNPMTAGSGYDGGCCAGNNVECDYIENWYNTENIYSDVCYKLERAVGHDCTGCNSMWLSSVYADDISDVYVFGLNAPSLSDDMRNYHDSINYSALCVSK